MEQVKTYTKRADVLARLPQLTWPLTAGEFSRELGIQRTTGHYWLRVLTREARLVLLAPGVYGLAGQEYALPATERAIHRIAVANRAASPESPDDEFLADLRDLGATTLPQVTELLDRSFPGSDPARLEAAVQRLLTRGVLTSFPDGRVSSRCTSMLQLMQADMACAQWDAAAFITPGSLAARYRITPRIAANYLSQLMSHGTVHRVARGLYQVASPPVSLAR